MKKIGILNTSIATENIGDYIIMDSALHELQEIMAAAQIVQFPTHEVLSRCSYRIQRYIDFNIACGTNLLHSHMALVKQWNIGVLDAFRLKPVVLMGVGWRSQARRKPDFFTRWLLGRVLSPELLHSVRDSYAEAQLKTCGINNVINTGCPTIWSLDEKHCKGIPAGKAKQAIITLTDYSKKPELDRKLLELALAQYEKCYFWCQGVLDLEYITRLGFSDRLSLLPSNIASYNNILSDTSISLDYIGTRLHGGIRALQHSRRSIIIGIDHRANVMGADFNLPVVDRYAPIEALEDKIVNGFATQVTPPVEKIKQWKAQFSG